MTDAFATMADGCRLAYRLDGPEDAPILLLSNSLGTNMAMWAPQMGAWAERFRILRYDQRGHGRSDAPKGDYSIGRLGLDAIELLDALDMEKAHFCGLSLGGMVGQWLGVRHPRRVGRLVLANTSSFMGPAEAWAARMESVLRDGMGGLGQASLQRWFTPAFVEADPAAIAPIARMLQATDPVGYAGCCAAIRDMDMRPIVHLIAAPTLVIGGDQDPATPPSHSRALAEAIAGSTLAMLDAAHLSNVEKPEAFGALVADFLT